ncbi:GIY-YIG nuclease family protein [Streptomyces sp. NPDC089424]|uniref:GIY-YIG nuclease family protein n=1 Tax=Streptomyces sp. NPDC089424 TaxID=3365917 RepID=UPI0037F7532B
MTIQPQVTGSLPTRPAPGYTAVYRFYNAEDVLLYIGICDEPLKRWYNHAVDKPWWPDVARFGVTWFPSRDEALEAERKAILEEKPLHNVVWNGIPYNSSQFPMQHLYRLTRERLGDRIFSLRDLVDELGIPPGSAYAESRRLREKGLFQFVGKMKGRSGRAAAHYRALPLEGEVGR